jgi:hypothetical protein
VKGVGYDPARPGELPWARDRSIERVDHDFRRMREAGFNTVRTWEPLTVEELDTAARHELAVIQGIWVDPEGDFAADAFRQAAVDKAAAIGKASRGHPAVLSWLLMNEPRPEAVRRSGLEPTRRLLREMAAAVRAVDPGVPVGFSSWPGLEMLDEPSLDFVAVNLYPFRPSHLRAAVGYQGMVRLWRERQAGDRPLLVSEYGLSVAPVTPAPDAPGGETEERQASGLATMAGELIAAGAAGGAVFLWIDGWWKNNETVGDEQSHDPADGEEWFGLVAMDAAGDRDGRARPALAAMQAFNEAILTEPPDGPVGGREVEVEVHCERTGALELTASLDGGPPVRVPVVREGPWLRGRLGLRTDVAGAQELALVLADGNGPVASFHRTLVPDAPALDLEVVPGTRRVRALAKDAAGAPLPARTLRLAVTEPTRLLDTLHEAVTDQDGSALIEVPESPSFVLVSAAMDGAVAWAVVPPDGA